MEETRRGVASAEITTAVVQLLAKHTGHGPTKAHTTINRDSILVVLGDTLTRGERTLADSGMGDDVIASRRAVQDAMREEMVDLVEERTGRMVIASMSDQHLDPDVSAQVFVLEPLLR